MEIKRQITSDAIFRGYPFQHRLANVSSRYKTLRSNLDLWSIYAGLKTVDSIDEESRKLLPQDFSALTGGNSDDYATVSKRLAGIIPQLRAAVVVLSDSVKNIENCISKIRGSFASQNINQGVKTIIDLERNELSACERFVDHLNVLIRERTTQDRHVVSNIIDLMVSDVYEQVTHRAKQEHIFSSDTIPLPPVFYTVGQSFSESQWSQLQQLLWRQGRALPISLLPVSPRVRDQVWNVARGYVQVCRKLYSDLGIDRDIEQIVLGVTRAHGLSPAAQQLVQSWRGEFVAELCATLVAGPAYAGASIELLSESADSVLEHSASPFGVSTYHRWKAILSTLAQSGFQSEVEPYRRAMLSFYGPDDFVANYPTHNRVLQETLECIDTLVGNVLHTPLMVLKGNTLRDFFPRYEAADYQHSIAGMNEILSAIGLSTLSTQTSESSINGGSKTEKTSRSSSAKSSDKNIGSTRVERGSEVQVSQYVAACRFAFERVGLTGEIPPRFETQCKSYIASALDRFYQGPEATRIQKDITTEDVHRLIRVAYVGAAKSRSPQSLGWI